MNKINLVNKLIEKTKREKEECIIINEIIQNHGIIGRKNKEKIKKDLTTKLKITQEEANELYNICAELWIKEIL